VVDPVVLILNLTLAVVAAALGGALAQRLGLPVIVGYLLAGVALGQRTPGPVADVRVVQVMAELGVTFLMFGIGAELSIGEIRRVGRVAGLGGAGQMLATIALVAVCAPLLGLSGYHGLFLGSLLAVSSTAVALKVLMGRGEMGSVHARLALGLAVIQDLAVVPLMVLLPALAGRSGSVLADLALALAKAALLLGATLALGGRTVPWLLARMARAGSRELFLLVVVGIALGTALLAHALGLSLALGAFLAGLLVAESELAHQAVAEILPLRDLFATLFFTSVGMLIDPVFVLAYAGPIAFGVALVVLGKGLVTAAAPLAFGYSARVALLVGASLAQVGEFSFVLAQQGRDLGLIPSWLYDLTLSVALVSILLTPFLVRAAPPLQRWLARLPAVGRRFAEPVEPRLGSEQAPRLHAVICGFGRVGGELAEALALRGFHFLVIELDPWRFARLQQRGIPAIYGDAANPAVLAHANLEQARVLAATMPDARAAALVARHARAANRRLNIVARAQSAEDVDRLYQAGADEVVHPQFEAGLEFVRHALHHYGVAAREIELITGRRREAHYTPTAAE